MDSSKDVQIQFQKPLCWLSKVLSVGHDAACRLPGNNNVGLGGKHRVKKEIQIALATLSRSAGNEAEERSQKILMCFLVRMVQRKQTCWEKGGPSCLVIFCRNHVID